MDDVQRSLAGLVLWMLHLELGQQKHLKTLCHQNSQYFNIVD